MTAPDATRDGHSWPDPSDVLGKLRQVEANAHRLELALADMEERALTAEAEVDALTHGVLSAIRRDHRDGRTGVPCLVRALVGGAVRVIGGAA